MAISVLNWALTKSVLERDHPNADPAEIDRYSVVAALVPGNAGLMVPLIADAAIEDKDVPGDSVPVGGAPAPPPDDDTKEQLAALQAEMKTLEQTVTDKFASFEASLAAAIKAMQDNAKPQSPTRGTT